MRRILLRGALVADPETASLEPGSLLLEGERIAARLRPGAPEPADAERIELPGRTLAPGFVDLHHHGRVIFAPAGSLAAALRHDARELVRHGTTAFLATTVATPRAPLLGAVASLAEAIGRASSGPGARVLGIHLEGPWIARDAAGAHPPDAVRPYARDEGEELWAAASGAVRMATLAPELPGAGTLLDALASRGILAALGHSRASPEQVEPAVARGARHVTHLFNAMGPLHHRAPGLAGAALSDDRLSCDLICDGVHVDPRVIRFAARVKRGRLALISDRLDPSVGGGAPLGGGALRDDGVVFRARDGQLAGSRVTLDAALRLAEASAGMTRIDAIAACSFVPARLLGLEREHGTLRPGARADLVALDDAGRVRQTWLAGRRVYDADEDVAAR